VQYAQKGNITVRMVSGDNLETAKAVAIKAGILSEEESRDRYACMSADEFRKIVGGMRKELEKDGSVKLYVQNKKEFLTIANRLRVLGRAIPSDKLLLVTGLKEQNKTVAVTGDGINDVDALKNADVGFAMGSGCSVAKDAADMILVEDNFEATMKAVMWGRNIYDNVRRFIQFQVTVNFSCLAVVFIGAVFKGESPLQVVQLLWINLIMDTLAALALATERP
jgi:Ca2+ transporting ATPase